MLPTFVIGLREGLEAALIVGIVAAFLRQRGRTDLLRWVFVGIFAAVALCFAAGLALDVVSRNLPQRQQEGLETVIAVFAVGMVTYMVVWMKRHSRDLKRQLDGAAESALAAGSAMALVAMAFLAVLREGLETVVFLLAAFNESDSGWAAPVGALLGILVAVGLGYGIYRGGVRINLSRFFRVTGVVLVLVAAGLAVSALHTAHEAGWLNAGQQGTVDLSAVVAPGSVQASLLTGMLGFQSRPVLIELAGWLLYLVPVGLFVAWPPGKGPSRQTFRRIALAAGTASAIVAVALAVFSPGAAPTRPVTGTGSHATQVVAGTGGLVKVRTQQPAPVAGTPRQVELVARRVGQDQTAGVAVDVYRSRSTHRLPAPATLSLAAAAARNGGRLPLGVLGANGRPVDGRSRVPVQRISVDVATMLIAPATQRVVEVDWQQQVRLVADFSTGRTVLGSPRTGTTSMPPAAHAAALNAARHDEAATDQRALLFTLAVLFGALALGLCTAGALTLVRPRQRPAGDRTLAPAVASSRPPAEAAQGSTQGGAPSRLG